MGCSFFFFMGWVGVFVAERMDGTAVDARQAGEEGGGAPGCGAGVKKRSTESQYFFFSLQRVVCLDLGNPIYRSSETVSFFLPFLRRAAKTFLPLAVDIL
jgi:hypothetical protein